MRELVRASAHSMLRNVAYYSQRGKGAAGRAEEDRSRPARSAPRPRSNLPFPHDADLEAAMDASAAAAPLVPRERTAVAGAAEAIRSRSNLVFEEDVTPLAQLRATITSLAGLIDKQERVTSCAAWKARCASATIRHGSTF